jgi:hypothetical protein
VTAYLYDTESQESTDELWVDGTNGADVNTGRHIYHAKATIGSAITAANDGDTIHVVPGTYSEAVDCGSKSLRIVGGGTQTTIISTSTSPAIHTNATIELRSLTVTGTGAIAVDITATKNCRISDCIITSGAGAGATIDLTSSANATVERSWVACAADSVTTIQMAGCTGFKVDQCYVKASVTGPAGAVKVIDALAAEGTIIDTIIAVARNQVTANGLTAVHTGTEAIVIARSSIKVAASNASDTGDVSGVDVASAGSCIVQGCKIETSTAGSGTPLDLKVTSGTLIESGCSFTTSSGIVSRIPNVAAGSSGGLPLGDANARVDVGEWLGTAVTLDVNTFKPQIDVFSISGDAAAANNAEAFFDDTGFNASNSTIGTCTAIAANAIGASELAADAVTEIANGVFAILIDGVAFSTVMKNLQAYAYNEANVTDIGGNELRVDYKDRAGTSNVLQVTHSTVTAGVRTASVIV